MKSSIQPFERFCTWPYVIMVTQVALWKRNGQRSCFSLQMLVITPEKSDVVMRKSTGDVALAQLVKLLIIDEVHLLHDDRGSVIECLVARTLRQVCSLVK